MALVNVLWRGFLVTLKWLGVMWRLRVCRYMKLSCVFSLLFTFLAVQIFKVKFFGLFPI